MKKLEMLYKIEDSLKEKHIPMFDSPCNINEEKLELPSDITEIDSKALGAYLNAYTQHKIYVRAMLGKVRIAEEECRQNYFNMTHDKYLDYGKASEVSKNRMLSANPDFTEAYRTYSYYSQKRKMIEDIITNFEDAIFLISREITRRVGDIKDESR